MPRTVIAHSLDDTDALFDSIGKGPWILKLLASPNSFDWIVVADTKEAAAIALSRVCECDRDVVLQQFVSEANREDIRALVIDHEVLGGVVRRATRRACFPTWDRATVTVAELTSQEKGLARNAASSLQLAIADVTLLRSERGPLVLDVNPFPLLEHWGEKVSESACHRVFDLVERHMATR